jgi:heterodisulfide reductase subunit B
MSDLTVGPYYGCQILRPRLEMEMDDPDNPRMMEDLFRALGCEVVDYPYKTECCGSYNTVGCPEIALERSGHILRSARGAGADVLAASCPLCHFNLDARQSAVAAQHGETYGLPVMYFTQVLALALGCGVEDLGLDLHAVDLYPVLRQKGLLEREEIGEPG